MERFRKGPWSEEEDEVLRNWVAAYGPQNWSCLQSKGLLMRTGKSCRLRWVNILRPGLKKGRKFSREEEERVVRLQAQFGNKWARIAEFFPGRTDNDVKNLWSMRKKKLARSQGTPLPSISGVQTGVHVPELTITYDQQQDKDIQANYLQDIMGIPCISHCLDTTTGTPVLTRPANNPGNTDTTLLSAPFVEVIPCISHCLDTTTGTPVLTRPTNNSGNTNTTLLSAPSVEVMQREQYLNVLSAAPVLALPTSNPPNTKSQPPPTPVPTRPTNNSGNTNTTLLSAPFVEVMQREQYLNVLSAAPVLALPTSNPPNTKSQPPPTPLNSIMPHQQCLDFTSVTPVLTVPTLSTSAPLHGTTPQIQSSFFGSFFEAESHCSFLDCSCRGTISGPSIFDDLTASVLEFFSLPHHPDPKV